MRGVDVVLVLDSLAGRGIRPIIDGGWGVDALVGRETRPHRDLDLVVDRTQAGDAVAVLASLAYRHDSSAGPGVPARIVMRDPADREVDLHLVVIDARGNGWQELDEGAWGAYPAEGLAGRGTIGGREVLCITAELQLRHHLGYAWSDSDVHDMRLLGSRFGIALPPPYDEGLEEIPPLPDLGR